MAGRSRQGRSGRRTPSALPRPAAGSIGVFASGTGSTITIDGPSIVTRGARRSRRGGDLRRQRRSQWRERNDARRRLVRGGRAPFRLVNYRDGYDDYDAGQCRRGRRPTGRRLGRRGPATATLTNDKLVASGVQGIGVLVEGGGTANLLGVTVSTTGSGAPAVVVNGAGSLATLSGANSLTTTGDGSIGLYALGGGVIDATGPTTISTGNTSAATGLSAFGVNADGAGIANQSRRDHGHDVGDERLWVLRQQRRDDLRAGRAEHNHVRKWLDRPLRLWRRVDHHRRRRVDRHSRRLGAGRAGRPRRACDAERRFGDDHGQRLARSVRERRRLAGDAQRREHLEHRLATARSDFTPWAAASSMQPGPTTISTFGTTSTSTGLSAFGVNADGAGSQINLAATTVTTSGTNAFGFYASNGGRSPRRTRRSVTTSGNGSIGLYASGGGSTITADGASIVNLRRLGAGRASRHWRARDAERRERDAEHQRRRGVESDFSPWAAASSTRPGRPRSRPGTLPPRRASAPSASMRTARDRKSISPRRRSRRRGRTPMGSTPTAAGTISAPDAPSITTFGNGSIGLYASGGGSTITADGASIVNSRRFGAGRAGRHRRAS